MRERRIAFALAFGAALIYGVNFTIAKEVMPTYVRPFGFILLRASGATLLFWACGLFIRKEVIQRSDYPRLFLGAVFGIALNQLTFFKGLSLTTPISASVIMVSSPILVLTFSAILIREKVTKRKVSGILIGLVGAVLLIVFGKNTGVATNATWGNFLVFVNASSYSLYLILIKGLTDRYHPVVLAKWIYLIGFLMILPFGWSEFKMIDWVQMPSGIYWRIAFVVVCTSFLTYLFNLFAIRKLKPTTLSIFIYLQPVLATSYALIVGSDQLNLLKVLATVLIFIGVFLVTRKPQEASV